MGTMIGSSDVRPGRLAPEAVGSQMARVPVGLRLVRECLDLPASY